MTSIGFRISINIRFLKRNWNIYKNLTITSIIININQYSEHTFLPAESSQGWLSGNDTSVSTKDGAAASEEGKLPRPPMGLHVHVTFTFCTASITVCASLSPKHEFIFRTKIKVGRTLANNLGSSYTDKTHTHINIYISEYDDNILLNWNQSTYSQLQQFVWSHFIELKRTTKHNTRSPTDDKTNVLMDLTTTQWHDSRNMVLLLFTKSNIRSLPCKILKSLI